MSLVVSFIIIALLVLADQLIKFLVSVYLKPVTTVAVIKGVLNFTYVENTGAVFGSFSTYTVLLTVVSVILLAVTVFFLATKKSKSKIVNSCLILMVSGGIGNIIDRIRLHYVVDFIEPVFVNFAVFNFADCLITVGAFTLIIYLFVEMYKDSSLQKKVKSKFGEGKKNEKS